MKKARKKKPGIDVVTLFPGMFDGPLGSSMIGRAREKGLVRITVHDLRRWSADPKHGKVDDRPFGGGAGMLIAAEPVYRALKSLKATGRSRKRPRVLLMTPQGAPFTQKTAERLAGQDLVIVCGHYEGIDERVMPLVDEEISIGDYVLTGGELPAMVVIDTVVRLVPGVVGDPESLKNDSFSSGLLDYPHFTRPRLWRGQAVPEVLLSGNHRLIEAWRREQALERTRQRRPDLLQGKKFKLNQR